MLFSYFQDLHIYLFYDSGSLQFQNDVSIQTKHLAKVKFSILFLFNISMMSKGSKTL